MEKFTPKQASEILGLSQRGVKYYYLNHYTSSTFVSRIDRNVFLTQSFIDAVKKNREGNSRVITDSRTKDDLLKIIAELEKQLQEQKENNVFDIAENERIEVFTQDEYNLFSERLIQWRLQRQEIEQTKVIFETIKDERDFLKTQLDYFKTSNDKILVQHQNLIEIIGQRNRIEAVEKGAIPKEPREI